MRLMGGALVALAGLMLGLISAGALRKEARRRAELCWLLESMAYELERFRAPLPELFYSLARQTEGAAADFCRDVLALLPELGRSSFSELWSRALAPLPPRERTVLSPLGAVLGRYGTEELLAATALCRREMEQARREAAVRAEKNGRVYIGLCAAGGLMLAVALL